MHFKRFALLTFFGGLHDHRSTNNRIKHIVLITKYYIHKSRWVGENPQYIWIGYQVNQDSSGNQKNVIQGQRPDMTKQTHNREHKIIKIIHTR